MTAGGSVPETRPGEVRKFALESVATGRTPGYPCSLPHPGCTTNSEAFVRCRAGVRQAQWGPATSGGRELRLQELDALFVAGPSDNRPTDRGPVR